MNILKTNFSILVVLLAGCAVGPEYTKPQMPRLPTQFSIGKSKSLINVDTLKWWESFNDTCLNKLVNIALQQNLTILQATERINSAKENILAVKADLFPSLQTSVSNQIIPKLDTNSTGRLHSDWKIDLFGQKRRMESALANFDSVYAQSEIAKLTIIAKLISTYIDARHFQERISIAHKILDLYKRNLKLTRLKLFEGAISKLPLIKLEAELKSIESEIPNLEKGFRVNVHNISTLLGHSATDFLAYIQKIKKPFQPNLYMKINIGIPADLIRNRPDIRYREKNIADSIAKIGIAKADLYPAISLNGFISLAHDNISPGYHSGWSFGPKLYVPIFDGQKIRSNIRRAESFAHEQYIAWQETVLNAVKEVEDALISINQDKKVVTALQNIVELYKQAMSLSAISYRQGKYSLIDLLDIQKTTAKAEVNLSIAKRQLAKSYVDLYVAIGSGYNP
ncbi:efflux transporter outer membrane subunit [Candidatus Liberibacter solanacearum]|uniref:Efflux transporter outer membrane subunit n=1 Tax=Candidatus Liberibacter solanacearum TaxID=556287 RepID=A0A3R7R920_9HYPH|nr:efflux transporter outer membrane subunit [Candidatus Liberibacter solanacearum]RPD36969.1 efflux transporter outer membrane subunit [Candidatus Liberibacter solanacearum]